MGISFTGSGISVPLFFWVARSGDEDCVEVLVSSGVSQFISGSIAVQVTVKEGLEHDWKFSLSVSMGCVGMVCRRDCNSSTSDFVPE